jgi:hypothetical protein
MPAKAGISHAISPRRDKLRKQFFFEKKNQKTFAPLAFAWGAIVASSVVPGHKVFLVLFVHKKNCFLFPRL